MKSTIEIYDIINRGTDTVDGKLSFNQPHIDFQEDYPDYRSGYNGNLFSKSFIKESLIKFHDKFILKK